MEEITPELRSILAELFSGQLSNEHLLIILFGVLFGVTVALAHLTASSLRQKNQRMARRMDYRGRRRIKAAVRAHVEENLFGR